MRNKGILFCLLRPQFFQIIFNWGPVSHLLWSYRQGLRWSLWQTLLGISLTKNSRKETSQPLLQTSAKLFRMQSVRIALMISLRLFSATKTSEHRLKLNLACSKCHLVCPRWTHNTCNSHPNSYQAPSNPWPQCRNFLHIDQQPKRPLHLPSKSPR